jgi:hypothetical protein
MKKIKLSLAGLPKMNVTELKKVVGGQGYAKALNCQNGKVICNDSMGNTFCCYK